MKRSFLTRCSLRQGVAVLSGLLSVAAFQGAQAVTIPTGHELLSDRSMVFVRQFENPITSYEPLEFTSELINFTSSDPYVYSAIDSPLGSDIEAYADVTAGKIGVGVQNYLPDSLGAASSVQMFDTLNFQTRVPVEISYALDFDGVFTSHSSTNALGGPSSFFAFSAISIYDITGMDAGWITKDTTPSFDPFYFTSAPLISRALIETSFGGQSGILEVIETEIASFLTEPGKEYGINIWSTASAAGVGGADFLNTASMRFTDLGGASFTSGSGMFLTQGAPAHVPEPSPLWLLLAAGPCLWLSRRLADA